MKTNKKRVLLVDDEEMVLEGLSSILKDAGCEVETAENGLEALEKLRSEKPFALLLTDFRMPKLNGLKLIQAARKEFPEMKSIMMTAHADINSAVSVMKEEVFDYVLKPFDSDVMTAIVKKCLHYQEIETVKCRLEKERAEDLEAGALVQQKFLTEESKVRQIFSAISIDTAIYNKAPATISGDFFIPKPINESSAGFFFADTCGHGLAAALISMRILTCIETQRSPNFSPREFLSSINQDIQGIMPRGRFTAASYAIFNVEEGFFAISNAGQPYPILIRQKGVVEEVEAAGYPLGQRQERFFDVELNWFPGDRVILLTDGIIESENPDGELYGNERLLKLIERHARSPIEELKNLIISDLKNFAGNIPAEDDITLIIFEFISGKERKK